MAGVRNTHHLTVQFYSFESSSLKLSPDKGQVRFCLPHTTEFTPRKLWRLKYSADTYGRRFLLQAGLVGDSPAMKALACQIHIAARSDLTVLVSGESRTGKELVARAIHKHSSRNKGALVCFNCGAITETLLESELFGYVCGAFTGADRDRMGVFEATEGGTPFLDEVGEMAAFSQSKLLRVLQERAIRPVGDLTESR
jgi:transcriptional regulator with GAF, ATPase, and Fis domain